jgi:hypothetical protein
MVGLILWVVCILYLTYKLLKKVALRMKGISGETGSLKLYSYETDGSLKEVPAELWHIQTEAGETPDTLSDNILYEVHFTVQDNEAFDLCEEEKEIKISAVLGNA